MESIFLLFLNQPESIQCLEFIKMGSFTGTRILIIYDYYAYWRCFNILMILKLEIDPENKLVIGLAQNQNMLKNCYS